MIPPPYFRGDIQALRAIAVVLVVVFHAWPAALPGGYVGVDVFFVISGYLITALLLRELEASGRIDFAAFYARRIRRLLPAAALVIVATVCMFALTHSVLEARQFVPSSVAAALYVSNLWFASRSVEYLQDGVETDPLLHTWSLGVEEQFYLVWPALLLAAWRLAPRRSPPRLALAWVLVGAGLASLLASVLLTSTSASWAFFSLPTRAWEFCIGAAAVLLQPHVRPIGAAARRAAVWLGLLCMVGAAFAFSARTPFPGVVALLPVVGAFLVIVAGGEDLRAGAFDPLRSRALAWLGDRSYSLYLWHWPVLIAVAQLWPGSERYQVVAAGVILSLLLAALSFQWVENPVRHHQRLRTPRRALALGAALMVGTLGVAVCGPLLAPAGFDLATRRAAEHAIRDRPRLYDDRCFASALQADPPACMYGDASARHTIVLVGDSHAAQWFPALEELARTRKLRIAVFVKAACPLADFEPFDPKLGRPYTECTRWRETVFSRMAQLRPELVVVSQASTYDPFVARGAEAIAQWQDALVRSLDRLATVAGHVTMIRDTPLPGFHVPRCLAREAALRRFDPAACHFVRETAAASAAFEVERAAAAGRAGVSLLDLSEAICPAPICAVERDGIVLFHDAQHLSASFARSLAGVLWTQLPATVQARLDD